MRYRAFTIVELLVTIAIIGVLAALLFPVLASAKEASVRTVSAANLQSLLKGTLMYAHDHDDVMPPFQNYEPWLAARDPYVTTFGLPTDSKQPAQLKAVLSRYLGREDRIWFCPADKLAHRRDAWGQVNHEHSSYIYADYPVGYVDEEAGEFLATPISNLSPTIPTFREPTQTVGKELTGYWHARVQQNVFIDGHVQVFHFRP